MSEFAKAPNPSSPSSSSSRQSKVDGSHAPQTTTTGEGNNAASSSVAASVSPDNGAENAKGGAAVAKGGAATQPIVDVTKLSDLDLIKLMTQKEWEKKKERYQRHLAKHSTDLEKDHKFWHTQPVPKLKDAFEGEHGPIDDKTNVAEVKQEPYAMPAGFTWCDLDVFDPVQIGEMYKLLNENYVEDDDCMFRFDYSVPFLQWALTPPHYLKEWHVGVRTSKGKLMGCITAVPADVRVHDSTRQMVEINFLCVHKKLRTQRLAPVLIKEITRRVNLTGRWQAVYTAGVVLPKPVSKCQYFHRSLNPKKLIEIKFSSLPPKVSMASLIKKLTLPKQPIHDLRPMVPADTSAVHTLVNASLARRKLVQVFSEEEIAHILLPREGVVNTYVLETKGVVTDVCSFYHLPSTVMTNPNHSKLNAVYSYYNVATTITFEELMRDALICARNVGADVFNALDLAENKGMLEPLLFGAGDGHLQYYVYNWKCPELEPKDVGIVLL